MVLIRKLHRKQKKKKKKEKKKKKKKKKTAFVFEKIPRIESLLRGLSAAVIAAAPAAAVLLLLLLLQARALLICTRTLSPAHLTPTNTHTHSIQITHIVYR